MDFVRRLEDVTRISTSIGCRHAVRFDDENMILMLMRKLPNENLKRRWTEIASDLIQTKGQVSFGDFLNFIRRRADRLNNRFGREFKLSMLQFHTEKRHARDRQEQPRKATTLRVTAQDNT